jgi:formyl-CoA transferase
VFAAHPWPEWRKRLRHHEITFGLLGILRDVPHDHQAVANGAVVESSLPDMPRTLSAPIRLSFAPEPVTPGPGPGHGQHTDEVLLELGYSRAEVDKLRTAGALG